MQHLNHIPFSVLPIQLCWRTKAHTVSKKNTPSLFIRQLRMVAVRGKHIMSGLHLAARCQALYSDLLAVSGITRLDSSYHSHDCILRNLKPPIHNEILTALTTTNTESVCCNKRRYTAGETCGSRSGSHGDENEDDCLLECCTAWSGRYWLTFQRSLLTP
jgi:hypothetical protein